MARVRPPVQASELITRALRLINIPGRGASLSAEEQNEAFEALQELLDSKAVSKLFIPGISRHFFSLTSGQSIYTYGPGADVDFRSDDFGSLESGLGDPAPIKIEQAYVRVGSSITDNELIENFRFESAASAADWTLSGAAAIENNQLKIEQAVGAAVQSLTGITQNTTYTLRFDVEMFDGDVTVRCQNNAVDVFTIDVTSTGFYEYDFGWTPAVNTPTVEILTDAATDDVRVNHISLMERSATQRLSLPDGIGSDYPIRVLDQKTYNRKSSKGTGGRAGFLLYSRNHGNSEIRFDHGGTTGEILVLDVLVNRAKILRVEDEIRLPDDAILWLRYALADVMAGEHGRDLRTSQVRIMNDAWNNLAAGNRRTNTLRVDGALRRARGFDIDAWD